MSDLNLNPRVIRAGAAARIAEQESKRERDFGSPVHAPHQVQAGSSARDSEDRKRSLDEERRGPVGFSLRAAGGRVDRVPERLFRGPKASPAYQEKEASRVTHDEVSAIAPLASQAGTSVHAAEPAILTSTSPGLLQNAAAQLQSRIRAFFKSGESS